MLSRPDTPYLTFVSNAEGWWTYRGVGGPDVVARQPAPSAALSRFAGSAAGFGIACTQSAPADASVLVRIWLTTLDSEEVTWSRGRIGALACAPDGDAIIALELPESPGDETTLLLSTEAATGTAWTVVPTQTAPDISSGLAWISPDEVAYESTQRRLTVARLHDGSTRSGLAGSSPASAPLTRSWFAVVDGGVVAFTGSDPTIAGPVAGFRIEERPSSLWSTSDGQVLSWHEPDGPYRSRAFVQSRLGPRQPVAQADAGIVAVLGPIT